MSKIYLISQNENTDYDTYDSAVVVADSEEVAKMIQPSPYSYCSWASPEKVKVSYIGEADERFKTGDVICASFNAG